MHPERLGNGDAVALLEVRPSWGAALAGAVTMLAIAILLWGLAVAIVAVSSRPFEPIHDSLVALWLSAMMVTLLGALGGGYAAGFLSRDPRPAMGAAHGFLAWAVALLAAFLVQFSVAKTLWMTMGDAAPETAGVTIETHGAATIEPGTGLSSDDIAHQPRPREHLVVLSWSWFGTWFLSAILATAAGRSGARSVRGGRRPTFQSSVDVSAPFASAPTR
jgi:hypothetical protein